MVDGDKYKQELLKAWEDVYKKGQLTLWLFLALKEKPKYVTEIKDFIESYSNNSITCEEQSLYRALRKYYDLEMVDFEPGVLAAANDKRCPCTRSPSGDTGV